MNIINKNFGFTLLELMIVVAIISFLSIIAIPNLMKFLAKAKRTEAYINLSSLAMAEKAYFAENGKYTSNIASELNWTPEGNYNYTYGFSSGSANDSYFIGKLNTPPSNLANITSEGFIICATGDIDGDGKPDVISINQNNEIKILEDDLI